MKILYTVYNRKSNQQENGLFIHPVQSKGRFATPEQAQPLADMLTSAGELATVGKYYIFTREEWAKDQYKSHSITDPKQKTTMINGDHGTTLIFEHLHFEIEK